MRDQRLADVGPGRQHVQQPFPTPPHHATTTLHTHHGERSQTPHQHLRQYEDHAAPQLLQQQGLQDKGRRLVPGWGLDLTMTKQNQHRCDIGMRHVRNARSGSSSGSSSSSSSSTD